MTCQRIHMEESVLFFNKCIHWEIEDNVVCGSPFIGDIHWLLASFPIRFCGLVLYSIVEATPYVFFLKVSIMGVTRPYLCDSGIYGMDSKYACALASLCNTLPIFDQHYQFH